MGKPNSIESAPTAAYQPSTKFRTRSGVLRKPLPLLCRAVHLGNDVTDVDTSLPRITLSLQVRHESVQIHRRDAAHLFLGQRGRNLFAPSVQIHHLSVGFHFVHDIGLATATKRPISEVVEQASGGAVKYGDIGRLTEADAPKLRAALDVMNSTLSGLAR